MALRLPVVSGDTFMQVIYCRRCCPGSLSHVTGALWSRPGRTGGVPCHFGIPYLREIREGRAPGECVYVSGFDICPNIVCMFSMHHSRYGVYCLCLVIVGCWCVISLFPSEPVTGLKVGVEEVGAASDILRYALKEVIHSALADRLLCAERQTRR